MASKRRLARVSVMQTLFAHEFAEAKTDNLDTLLQRTIEEHGADNVDRSFAESLLAGVQEHREDVIQAMQTHAPQWPLERMETIARCILMIGTYEILYGDDAPPAVVMNEAIEIGKEYGEEETGKFVNGVLNAIAHR